MALFGVGIFIVTKIFDRASAESIGRESVPRTAAKHCVQKTVIIQKQTTLYFLLIKNAFSHHMIFPDTVY